MTMHKRYNFVKYLKKTALGIISAIVPIIFVPFFSMKLKAYTFGDFIQGYIDAFSLIRWKILWFLFFCCFIILFACFVVVNVMRIFNPSIRFAKIMRKHTCDMLKDLDIGGYSWGYNRTIVIPRNPIGWAADHFLEIEDYGWKKHSLSTIMNELPGDSLPDLESCKVSYTGTEVKRTKEDPVKFSITHIEQNTNKDDPKVEICLQKVDSILLQTSRRYLRRLDDYNLPIQGESDKKKTAVEQRILKAFQEKTKYLINSFCLHLILVTLDGKVILKKDEHSQWVPTINKELVEDDLINENGPESDEGDNYVTKWVKRALTDEFGIDRNDMNKLYEFVREGSLRILSIDMEADIYNVALTCYVKLKKPCNDFVDRDTERYCGIELDEIPGILMGYPDNCRNYQPSTYLRLLMYYLSQKYVKETEKTFAQLKWKI